MILMIGFNKRSIISASLTLNKVNGFLCTIYRQQWTQNYQSNLSQGQEFLFFYIYIFIYLKSYFDEFKVDNEGSVSDQT